MGGQFCRVMGARGRYNSRSWIRFGRKDDQKEVPKVFKPWTKLRRNRAKKNPADWPVGARWKTVGGQILRGTQLEKSKRPLTVLSSTEGGHKDLIERDKARKQRHCSEPSNHTKRFKTTAIKGKGGIRRPRPGEKAGRKREDRPLKRADRRSSRGARGHKKKGNDSSGKSRSKRY